MPVSSISFMLGGRMPMRWSVLVNMPECSMACCSTSPYFTRSVLSPYFWFRCWDRVRPLPAASAYIWTWNGTSIRSPAALRTLRLVCISLISKSPKTVWLGAYTRSSRTKSPATPVPEMMRTTCQANSPAVVRLPSSAAAVATAGATCG
ncbi:hypothetical protein D3C84_837390 [compost metagenome]